MDYFSKLRENMTKTHGVEALKHPAPGFITKLPEPAALASILPPLNDFSHISKPYDAPIVSYEEVLPPTQDMEVDQ